MYLFFLQSKQQIADVRGDELRMTKIMLYLWIFATLFISAMDLALGVIFGIDYGRFADNASKQNFFGNSGMAIFISAQTVSMSMMIIAFKGFILWIINIGLVCYLFTETFLINKAVTSSNVSNFEFLVQNKANSSIPIDILFQ